MNSDSKVTMCCAMALHKNKKNEKKKKRIRLACAKFWQLYILSLYCEIVQSVLHENKLI